MLAQSKALEEPLANAVNFWQVLLLMAVLPPLCEELAFRGFILSGFRHLGHKWWAIVLSAVAFGGVHVFLQQKASAAVVGVIIGYLAVQTGSLWPGIVYHMLHNGLQLSALRLSSELENAPQDSLTQRLLGGENPLVYQPAVVALVLVAAAGILWMLRGEPPQATSEEQVEEARRQANTLVGAQESPAAPH
jgi:sodium transport system permease protein